MYDVLIELYTLTDLSTGCLYAFSWNDGGLRLIISKKTRDRKYIFWLYVSFTSNFKYNHIINFLTLIHCERSFKYFW